MRQHLFLHYGWFLQNLEKGCIRTNMHTTVHIQSSGFIALQKSCIFYNQYNCSVVDFFKVFLLTSMPSCASLFSLYPYFQHVADSIVRRECWQSRELFTAPIGVGNLIAGSSLTHFNLPNKHQVCLIHFQSASNTQRDEIGRCLLLHHCTLFTVSSLLEVRKRMK